MLFFTSVFCQKSKEQCQKECYYASNICLEAKLDKCIEYFINCNRDFSDLNSKCLNNKSKVIGNTCKCSLDCFSGNCENGKCCSGKGQHIAISKGAQYECD